MVEKKRAMQRRRISSTMHAEKQRGPAEKEREREEHVRGVAGFPWDQTKIHAHTHYIT